MNYSFEYIDIILLAMIAGFIFLRLRGIMGKRTGFEGKAPPQFEEILKSVLKEALKNFEGTLILISHDRDFLQGLSEIVYEFKDKNIKPYEPGIGKLSK